MNDSNEWTNWIEDAISTEYIKYYEYKYFGNFQKIGSGGFGTVYRAKWRNSDKYFALKSFCDSDDSTIKEIVREVMIIINKYDFA